LLKNRILSTSKTWEEARYRLPPALYRGFLFFNFAKALSEKLSRIRSSRAPPRNPNAREEVWKFIADSQPKKVFYPACGWDYLLVYEILRNIPTVTDVYLVDNEDQYSMETITGFFHNHIPSFTGDSFNYSFKYRYPDADTIEIEIKYWSWLARRKVTLHFIRKDCTQPIDFLKSTSDLTIAKFPGLGGRLSRDGLADKYYGNILSSTREGGYIYMQDVTLPNKNILGSVQLLGANISREELKNNELPEGTFALYQKGSKLPSGCVARTVLSIILLFTIVTLAALAPSTSFILFGLLGTVMGSGRSDNERARVLEQELLRDVEERTPAHIRNNRLIDLSNPGEFGITLTRAHLADYDETNNPEGLGLKRWLEKYKKEAAVSTAGIRGNQNIVHPQDTRPQYPLHLFAILLATLAKARVAQDRGFRSQV
jgi:hypothetical protein